MWQSSNPALNNDDAFQEFYGHLDRARPDTCTVQGVVNKTAILVGIATIAGAGGYWLLGKTSNWSILTISCLASMVVCFGCYFLVSGNPRRAKVLGPVYAVVEGAFLGILTAVLDKALVQMDVVATGGLAVQAFVITIGILLAMLGLYKARILRPTQTFVAVVKVATVGIMITYALSWVLWMFGTEMPFISLGSAVQGGTGALIGLGLNLLILGVASMWLVIDFKAVEEHVAAGADPALEWFLGFTLLVSLAWIYYEAVKLAFRLALLLNRE